MWIALCYLYDWSLGFPFFSFSIPVFIPIKKAFINYLDIWEIYFDFDLSYETYEAYGIVWHGMAWYSGIVTYSMAW